MMKNLNYVNMFYHGVSEVQDLLKENQSPAAEFNVNLVTAFSVIVCEPEAAENMQKVAKTGQKVELSQVCPKLSQVQLTKSSIALIAPERITGTVHDSSCLFGASFPQRLWCDYFPVSPFVWANTTDNPLFL